MFLKARFAERVYQKHLECVIEVQVVEPYPELQGQGQKCKC